MTTSRFAFAVLLLLVSTVKGWTTDIAVALSMPNNLTAAAGGTVTVPINLNSIQSPFSLDAFQLIVEYDGTFFETPLATGIKLGTLTTGKDYTGLDNVTAATTSFTILRSATTNPASLTTTSSGSIMTVDMQVKPGLAAGTSGYLKFLAEQGSAKTELLTLSGDTIVFNPAVTSTGVWGLVTIPVPEPSTIVLGTAAVGVAIIAGRRHRKV